MENWKICPIKSGNLLQSNVTKISTMSMLSPLEHNAEYRITKANNSNLTDLTATRVASLAL